MTSATINVSTTDDALDEENETFTVTLTSATNAALSARKSAGGTILDNDSPPTVSVSNASATEGSAVSFTVSLSTDSGRPVTVAYATASGTATSGTDFTAASGTLTFAEGTDSQTVSVSTTEDTDDEGDETFTVTLTSPTNATLADDTATGTINDDDATASPTVNLSGGSETEGASVDFTVSLSVASAQTVTVDYASCERHGDERHRLHGDVGDTHVRGGHGFTDGERRDHERLDGRGERDVHPDVVEPDERDAGRRCGDRHHQRQRRPTDSERGRCDRRRRRRRLSSRCRYRQRAKSGSRSSMRRRVARRRAAPTSRQHQGR